MENNEIRTCHSCGRPFPVAPKCPCHDEPLEEYPCAMPACIRKKKPGCMPKAVIPAITVDSEDGITNFADCFVHATNTNTTFYVDDKHRVIIVWAGPVEVATYDIETNPLGLRAQTCYTTVNDVFTEVYFDKQGVGHIIGTEA